jgi:hypothetical protein
VNVISWLGRVFLFTFPRHTHNPRHNFPRWRSGSTPDAVKAGGGSPERICLRSRRVRCGKAEGADIRTGANPAHQSQAPGNDQVLKSARGSRAEQELGGTIERAAKRTPPRGAGKVSISSVIASQHQRRGDVLVLGSQRQVRDAGSVLR